MSIIKIKPCAICPYKLGQVKAFVNPCPQCELNGYNMFEVFKSRFSAASPQLDSNDKTNTKRNK